MKSYTIVALTDEYIRQYCMCLEEWSDEMKEAGGHKLKWYQYMKGKGLRVKLALNEEGLPVGMIQYYPVEYSPAEGKDIYYIHCIWVHGYKQGVGNYQKQGIGTALLEAATTEARDLGAGGIAAWGVSLPFWMKASWFKKHGFEETDRRGGSVLMWKRFSDDAEPPVWPKPGWGTPSRQKPTAEEPEGDGVGKRVTVNGLPERDGEGNLVVTGFINGACPAMNIVFERATRGVDELRDEGKKVRFQEIDTKTPSALAEWGIADGVFIGGRELRSGPPPSYKKVKKKIRKAL